MNSLRTNKYTHGPCPSCDGRTAKHLSNGSFRCLSVGCASVFKGKQYRPKRINRINPARAARSRVENYGALSEVVHTLTCCVIGCGATPEAHHLVTRGAGGKAWMSVDGVLVGNVVPLCLYHHRVWHDSGRETFQRDFTPFVVRLPRTRPDDESKTVETLAEVAVEVGEYARTRCGVDPLTNERTKR